MRSRRGGPEERLLVIRTVGPQPDWTYCMTNASPSEPLAELVRARSCRHRIEEVFQQAKGEVGLAHYEVQSWVGWHHHVTLAFLALWFLVLERKRLGGENPSGDRGADAGDLHRTLPKDLRQMIEALPAAALITADAGFVGYETWKAILESGRHLLIRVGANVRLLRNFGYAKEKSGLVYLWPDREAARKQPPLVLRLVVARGGRQPVYLVTSVLEETTLWDEQVVEVYAIRWGIELFYRHLKQTFGRRKLRSHSAENAEVEGIWSLLGLWAMGLHAQVELASRGIPARRISVAGILLSDRSALRESKSPPEAGESLRELLAEAVIDPYKRANKTSRDYPRKKQGHKIGAPQIQHATKAQIKTAREIRDQHPLGLTA